LLHDAGDGGSSLNRYLHGHVPKYLYVILSRLALLLLELQLAHDPCDLLMDLLDAQGGQAWRLHGKRGSDRAEVNRGKALGLYVTGSVERTHDSRLAFC
jgi:hypothetical protein